MKKSMRTIGRAIKRCGDFFGSRRASQRMSVPRSRRPQLEPLEQRQMLSITVNTPNDVVASDGYISLREAIVAANTNQAYYDAPAGSANETDVILFAPNVFDGSVGITFAAGNGQLELTDRAGIDIQGPGASLLTIDANQQDRVFNVATNVTASFSGLTISGGLVTGNGGGIYGNTGSEITLDHSTISGNMASSCGGGIYTNGTLDIVASTIYDNAATSYYGGGIYGSTGSVITISNSGETASVLSHNTALGYYGGAVYAAGNLSVINSAIDFNMSYYSGGGIYTSTTAQLTVSNSILTNNTTTWCGGAIASYGGTANISESTISGNESRYGGGIYVAGNCILEVSDSSILGNKGNYCGGGVYTTASNVTTIVNSTVARNTSTSGGGLHGYDGTLAVVNSVIVGNYANSGGGYFGGSNVQTDFINVSLAGNSAGWGGGVYNSGELNIVNTIIAKNYAEVYGSDTYESGTPSGTISNYIIGGDPLFVANPNPGTDGDWGTSDDYLGDLHLMHTSPAIDAGDNNAATDIEYDFDGNARIYRELEDGTVDIGAYENQGVIYVTTLDDDSSNDPNNEYTSLREALSVASQSDFWTTIRFGLTDSGTITLVEGELVVNSDVTIEGPGAEDLTIDANHQSRVFYVNTGKTATFLGMTITGGYVDEGADGGGIYNNGTLLLNDMVITGNEADYFDEESYGGGIFSNTGSTTNVTNSTISNNKAYLGGGIYDDGFMSVVNSAISDNEAGLSGGGILVYLDRTITISDSNIMGNAALSGGGGIYGCPTSTVTISNSVISGNSIEGYGGGICGSTINITNATVAGNYAGEAGGGIIADTLNVNNSIISLNESGTGNSYNIYGSISSGKNNLIDVLDPGFVENPSDGGDGWWDDYDTPEDESANNDYGDLRLVYPSPAIDSGDNDAAAGLEFDRAGNDRIIGTNVDIGAYEFQESLDVITVTTLFDDNGSVPEKSLREAITEAASSLNHCIIIFDDSLFLIDDTITLLNGQIEVNGGNFIIQGPDDHDLTIVADDDSRIFNVASGTTVRFSDMTITGGSVTGNGGGIYNAGNLTMLDVDVISNAATSSGGGIFNTGCMTIIGASISGNTASSGSGICNSGELVIADSKAYTNNTVLNGGTLLFTYGALGNSGSITFADDSTLKWIDGNVQDVSSRLVITNDKAATLDVGNNNVTLATGFGANGSGKLIKSGDGKLLLSGTNTYTGGTTISEGILQAKKTGALPYYSTLNEVVVQDGGTIAVNVGGTGEWTAEYIRTLLSRATFNSGSALGIDTSNVSGTGYFNYNYDIDVEEIGLTKLGNHYLVLNGNNTYAGVTRVVDGRLYIGSSGALGEGEVVVEVDVDGEKTVLVFSCSSETTVPNNISGDGQLRQSGAGNLILTGENTISEAWIDNYKTLQIGDGTTDDGSMSGDIYFYSLGNLIFANIYDQTYGGNLISPPSGDNDIFIEKTGSGVLTLTGDNPNRAFANLHLSIDSSSTLKIGNGGNNGSFGIEDDANSTIDNDGVLIFNRSNTVTLMAEIAGTGSLVQQGTGCLILTDDNTFNQNTINVQSGTVQILGSATLAGSITNNGTIDVEGSLTSVSTLTNNGTIKVTGNVTVSGETNTGTIIVVGDGEFTAGGTSIYGGANSISGAGMLVAWQGLEGPDYLTWKYQVSTNGVDYTTLIDGDETPRSSFMLTGLIPDTEYNLRIVASYKYNIFQPDYSIKIYDGGTIKTDNVYDPTGLHRIVSITSDDGPHDPLVSAGPSASTVESTFLSSEICEDIGLFESSIVRFQDVTPADPYHSDGTFYLDNSWVYAGSLLEAVTQSFRGLVNDGSVPTIDESGEFKLWRHSYDNNYDFYSFDENPTYPEGGLSYPVKKSYTCSTGSYKYGDNIICERGTGGPNGEEPDCGMPSESTGGAIITMPAIDSTGGATSCGGSCGSFAGLTYNSLDCDLDTGFGPGWSDVDELPSLIMGQNVVLARFGTETNIWFDKLADGTYQARYNSQHTLVHDAQYPYLNLTLLDGTVYKFYDDVQISWKPGSLAGCTTPDGYSFSASYNSADLVSQVLYWKTGANHAYQKRTFTYVMGDDDQYHVRYITLYQYDDVVDDYVSVRKITYDYYGNGEDYGMVGDLKTILTQEWDPSIGANGDWSGSDTNYFRYYIINDPDNGAIEHGLKRVLLANAYASFVSSYGDPDDPQNPYYGDTENDPIANFTCFSYKYDADGRVTERGVFGKSVATSHENIPSTNARGFNSWSRKSIEEQLDGVTETIFTNFLGEVILSDLNDGGVHTLKYNRYDAAGRLVFTVDTSGFVFYGGKYYNESLPDLVGYDDGDSEYLSDSDGLYQMFSYYATSGSGAAEGYLHQKAVAHGEDASRLAFGMLDEEDDPIGPIVLADYEYESHTVGASTIYVISDLTTYANEDGTGAATVEYDYTWYAGSFQYQQVTTILPVVSGEQNGPGGETGATTKQWYDASGNLTWSMDELGRVTYYQYEALTGRMIRTIEDIDAAKVTSLSLILPDNCFPPASGGINAMSDYAYDAFGRVTQTLGPEHIVDVPGEYKSVRTATWTCYDDIDHETRSAQGYVVVGNGNEVIVGPVSITKTDRDGRVTEQIQAEYTQPDYVGVRSDLAAAEFDPEEDYTAWTVYKYQKTRLVGTAVYDDIPDDSSDPDADGYIGTSGVNYELTTYGYENFNQIGRMGSQVFTTDSAGTIQHVFLDALGNVVETWAGTHDIPTVEHDGLSGLNSYDFRYWVSQNPAATVGPAGTNMVLISSNTYDADGNLLTTTQYPGGGAANITTEYQYDWRDRLYAILSPADVVTLYFYDNLGREIENATIVGDSVNLIDHELRDFVLYGYDTLGRVYGGVDFQINQQDEENPGAISGYLTSKVWYDARGYVIKTTTGNGLFQKYAYDGLGRIVASYICFDEGETDYADAGDVIGDTVVEQTRTWYNEAGETVAMVTYQRLPDDLVTTGELNAANSYATASVVWYDGLGRVTTTANYGREDKNSGLTHYFFDGETGALFDTNSDGIPDIAEATPHAPNTSDNYIVNQTQYDSAGRAYRSIDNLGRINETRYDDAGRVVRTIQNYANGTVEETDTVQDITVAYEYDSGGRLATMIVYNALGDDSNPNNENIQEQATKYLYTDTYNVHGTSEINASWQTGVVYPDSNDILSQNATTKVWTITTDNGDHVSTDYDQLGRTKETTDQRGVVHEYTYDSAGRLSADTVTSLGSSGIVDGAILRVETTYDDMSRVRSITNYSDTAGTAFVNQVLYYYNGWDRVYREYEEHDGAVGPNTEFVQYAYDYGATGWSAEYVRLAKVTYPDGREVNYDYGTAGAIDDIMSRLSCIKDDDGSTVLASYKYLGADTIVEDNYEGPDVKLSYNADNNLSGFDRFGRVVDQLWRDYGSSTDADRFKYGYDHASNRLWKENDKAANLGTPVHLDELYDYDALDQLLGMKRGNLVSGQITSPDFTQDWDLDGLGNWAGFDDDGTAQTRDTNAANEITAIDNSADDVAHDAAGNMIRVPKLDGSGEHFHLKYDAWNRLVKVYDDNGTTLVAEYQYDGMGRRIVKGVDDDADGSLDSFTHFFHSGNQVIETREGEDVSGEAPAAESLHPKHQFVWSPRYIDSLILRDEYDAQGQIIAANRLFYLCDANFNVTALVDTSGDVVERYLYTPYGEITVLDADFSTDADGKSDYANTTLYTGREFDAETEMQYSRARYYHAQLGRFVARDPIGYISGDQNLYRYCINDPLNQVDPSGLAGGYFYHGMVDYSGPVGVYTGDSPSYPRYENFATSELMPKYNGNLEGNATLIRYTDGSVDIQGRIYVVEENGFRWLATMNSAELALHNFIQTKNEKYLRDSGLQSSAECGLFNQVVFGYQHPRAAVARWSSLAAVQVAAGESSRICPIATPGYGMTVKKRCVPCEPVPTSGRSSAWVKGRYSRSASSPNAYWESGRQVFPTLRNSGLKGSGLRAAQKDFFLKGLREGKIPGILRGQAQEAGYVRRGGFLDPMDHLADPGAERALQEAIREVLGQ